MSGGAFRNIVRRTDLRPKTVLSDKDLLAQAARDARMWQRSLTRTRRGGAPPGR